MLGLISSLLFVRNLVLPTMGFCPLSYRCVVSLISRHPGGFESCRAEINQIMVEVSACPSFLLSLSSFVLIFILHLSLISLVPFCSESFPRRRVCILSLRDRSGPRVHERFWRTDWSRRRLEAHRPHPS